MKWSCPASPSSRTTSASTSAPPYGENRPPLLIPHDEAHVAILQHDVAHDAGRDGPTDELVLRRGDVRESPVRVGRLDPIPGVGDGPDVVGRSGDDGPPPVSTSSTVPASSETVTRAFRVASHGEGDEQEGPRQEAERTSRGDATAGGGRQGRQHEINKHQEPLLACDSKATDKQHRRDRGVTGLKVLHSGRKPRTAVFEDEDELWGGGRRRTSRLWENAFQASRC